MRPAGLVSATTEQDAGAGPDRTLSPWTPSPPLLGRPTLPLMRLVLGVGVVFVTGAGVQLYVLSDQTDRFFAWTIADPLSGRAIGGFYLTAAVVAGLVAGPA